MCNSSFPALLFQDDDLHVLKVILSQFVADKNRNLHFVNQDSQWKLLHKQQWINLIHETIQSYTSHCNWRYPSTTSIDKAIHHLYKFRVYERIYGTDTQFVVSIR